MTMNGSLERSLEERLHWLENEEIPRLTEAALHDDTSAALLVSARRDRDETRLALARWLDARREPWDQDCIEVGDTIDVVENGSEDVQRYVLLWETAPRPSDGWITDASPLGRALVGSRRGEVVDVNAPRGRISFRVVDFTRSA